jgi:branched-chain amino acid transport system ATP-binding protein
VVTLAAAVALERWYFQSPALTGVSPSSSAPLPPASPGGVELANTGGDRFAFSALAVVVLLVCALAVSNLRRGETGRRLLAVRANAGAAAASGVDVARTRLLAVAVASALAGVAGALFALQRGEVGAADWTLVAGLVLLAFAVVGGITSVGGAVLGGLLTAGGLVMAFATLHIDTLGQHLTALAGLALVAVTVLLPAGLAAALQPSCSHMATCLATWRTPEWFRAALRYGPWLAGGAAAGWLLWTRHEGFSWWMLLLGAVLALAVRQLLEALVNFRRARRAARPPSVKVVARPVRAAWPPPHSMNGANGANGWYGSNGLSGVNGSNGAHASNGASHAGNGAASPIANGAHPGLSVPRPRAVLARPILPPPVPGGRPLLRVTELTVSFGGVTALADVDLTIDEGSLAGLVGPNGAGKTAFVDAISGVVRATSGTVTFGDRSIGRLSTSARARRGLVRTFADGQVFDDLTVRDNLMVAAQRARWWSVVADLVRPGRRSRAVEDQVDWAIGALGLERVADEVAGGLSHSTRKLVAIARALALRPKLLVLDEPATGLADADRQVLRSRLRDLPARGTTVLLVDHDLGLASDVCDTVHVLDLGVVIASGPPVVLSTNEAVLHAYLGSNGHTAPLAPPSAAAKVAVTAMTVGRDT